MYLVLRIREGVHEYDCNALDAVFECSLQWTLERRGMHDLNSHYA